jgi:hypothetical protein
VLETFASQPLIRLTPWLWVKSKGCRLCASKEVKRGSIMYLRESNSWSKLVLGLRKKTRCLFSKDLHFLYALSCIHSAWRVSFKREKHFLWTVIGNNGWYWLSLQKYLYYYIKYLRIGGPFFIMLFFYYTHFIPQLDG